MEIKTVSRTTTLNTTEDRFVDKEKEVLLVGKDDKSLALSTPTGIKPLLAVRVTMDGIQTNLDAPITSYPKEQITMQRVPQASSATAPVPNKSGVLTTYRFSDDFYSYQEWRDATATTIWRRTWNTGTSSWNAFA